MKRGDDARYAGRIMARNKVKTEQQGKGSLEIENIYGNFTNWNMYHWREKSYQCATKQIISKIQEEKLMGGETFPAAGSSIQVQPVELRRQARGITRKNPAVAAAGR
jgi:hypothetical protein